MTMQAEPPSPATPGSAWRGVLVGLLVAAAALAWAHQPTIGSIAGMWLRSDTYAHGLLILPIVGWLAWRRRADLLAVQPRASLAGFAAVLALLSLWLFGHLSSTLVIEQAAIVAVIPAVFWAIAGTQALRVLRFAALYLMFAVPFGESLIAPMSNITADMTVGLLRATGFDVEREGLLFSTSVGYFEVARACSGVRYLIALLAVGTLYAYLMYRSMLRRAAFMLLAVGVAIVANGLRAYLIVVLAHVSNMRIAVGVDHVIYGWVFFGIVLLLLFWLGSLFLEPMPPATARPDAVAATVEARRRPTRAWAPLAMAALTAVLVAGVPLQAARLAGATAPDDLVRGLPRLPAPWAGPFAPGDVWQPIYVGATRVHRASYRSTAGTVDVVSIHYARESQGEELIGDLNRIADPTLWIETDRRQRDVALDGSRSVRLMQVSLLANAVPRRRWVWFHYRIDGRSTASELAGKLHQSWATLRGRPGGVLLAYSVEADSAAAAERTLAALLAPGLARFERCVDGVAAADCTQALQVLP